MAGTPRPQSDPAKTAEGDAPATTGASTAALVASTPDDRDVAPVVDTQATDGRRFRGIPTHGGTTITVSKNDFATLGVPEQGDVVFDFRKGALTVEVGTGENQISEEAAKALHAHEPTRFEFIGE